MKTLQERFTGRACCDGEFKNREERVVQTNMNKGDRLEEGYLRGQGGRGVRLWGRQARSLTHIRRKRDKKL